MRYLIILTLIAQLAVRFAYALPILLPRSDLKIQHKLVDSKDVILQRRGGGSGFFRPWNSKTISSDSVIKLSPEPAASSKPTPAQPAPVQAATTQPQVKPAVKAFNPPLKTKEMNRMMANSYGTRARKEVVAGVRGSFKDIGYTTAQMGKHSAKAVMQFGRLNGRQGMQHLRRVGRMGGMAATYGTLPLVKGISSGARSGGTAMKYKVKQWRTPKDQQVVSDTNLVRQKADQIRLSTPGWKASQDRLKQMWGPWGARQAPIPTRPLQPSYSDLGIKLGPLGKPERYRYSGPPPPKYRMGENLDPIQEVPSPPKATVYQKSASFA